MNDKTNVDIQYVSPLKRICMTIGELPASYLETMTYYEMLVWFVEFLKNQVIPTINNNAEAVKELQTLYEELRTYVNNYFDNLDVQNEINNKLDEMAESGELTDIIAQYLGLAGMITFNTVSEMKQAQNLVNGSKCQTLGYHSINDGGNALYKVRTVTNEDDVDEMTIIALNDVSLVAELIVSDVLNVKQLGAYGDNTHDDYNVLQTAFNNASQYTIYLPKGNYLINTGLTLTGSNLFIEGENANIYYSGTDYAITSTYLRYTTLKIGNINASNGGCIKLYVNSSSNQFVYDNFYFRSFSASTNCVYAHCEGGGWINEIRWFNGKLTAGQYGFNIEHDHTGQWADNAINGWHFNNIGIEGVYTGFYFNAISGRIRDFDFVGLRNAESFTTFLKTTGVVDRMVFYGGSLIIDTFLDLSSNTRNIALYTPIQISNIIYEGGFINNGTLYGDSNKYRSVQGGEELTNGTDLNNLTYPGTYTSSTSALTQSLTNKPTGVNSGMLRIDVIWLSGNIVKTTHTNSYAVQVLYSGYGIYTRKIEGTSWSSWKTLTSF